MIAVAVKKLWIMNSLDVSLIDGLMMSDIPMLQWTDEGREAFEQGEFCPLEGMGW